MHSAAKKIVHWMFAGVLAAAGSLASAFPVNVNLVGNPGFESGDAPWSPMGNAEVDGAAARSGNLGMFFRPNSTDGSTGMASQSFMLLSTETYTLDFYLKGNINALAITFNGIGLASFLDTLDIDPPDASDWVFYTGTFSGKTGGELKFNFDAGSTTASGLFLDDVNLACIDNCSDTNGNPMPEPGSLLLVGAALSALAVFRRRRSA